MMQAHGFSRYGSRDRKRMDEYKKKRLTAKGWEVGNADEFLEITPEEATYVELKLALSDHLKQQRQQRKLTQVELGRLLQSSQS